MRNYDIITWKDEDGVIYSTTIQYIVLTQEHMAYFETMKGKKLCCHTKDIVSLECDKRETMM